MLSEETSKFIPLIPLRTREGYVNFKQIGTSSSKSNYISFRAKSKLDEQIYTIRVLNIEGNLYAKKPNLAIKLYLQELFYLSARFGRLQEDMDSTDEILFFRNFEVGEDGSMAFVMKDTKPLSESSQDKSNSKAIFIEEFVSQACVDVLSINSRFGIANIDLNLDNICCFQKKRDGLPQEETIDSMDYFITNWSSGSYIQTPLELMLQDSTISLEERILVKIDDLSSENEDLKATPTELSKPNKLHLESKERKISNGAPEIYNIGLIALELLREMTQQKIDPWKDLVRIEDSTNYSLILNSIVKTLESEYQQSDQFCKLIAGVLHRDPQERVNRTRECLLKRNLSHESPSRLSQLQSSLSILSERSSLSKSVRTDQRIEIFSSTTSLTRTSDEDTIGQNAELKPRERKKSIIRILEDTFAKDSELPLVFNKVQPQQLERGYENKLLFEQDKYARFVNELQVQLLTVLEKVYGEKIPSLQVSDPETCIHDTLKLLLKKFFIDSQSMSKKLHPDVKALIDTDMKEVILSSKWIGDNEAIAIAKSSRWSQLKELYFHNNQITDRGIAELAEHKSWKNLEILDLRGNFITDEGATKIANNQSWVCLQQLWLYQNRIRDQGAIAIARNTVWKKLECLDLSRNFISDDGAMALGENVTWNQLRILHLYENEIGDRGVIALVNSKTWKNLTELDLEKNNIGYEGARALATNTTWTNLERCYLSGNRFEDKGVQLILESNKWKGMRELVLDFEQVSLGNACNLCNVSLKEANSQCYNYQKKIHYCFGCLKKKESTLLGMVFGTKNYIDPHALIFIDVTDASGLRKVLAKRIGDQEQPRNFELAEEANYHEGGCDVCMTAIGQKIRWKCLNCKNIDMCNKCYLLSLKRDMSTIVALKIKGHDVETHILQRYIFIEKNS